MVDGGWWMVNGGQLLFDNPNEYLLLITDQFPCLFDPDSSWELKDR